MDMLTVDVPGPTCHDVQGVARGTVQGDDLSSPALHQDDQEVRSCDSCGETNDSTSDSPARSFFAACTRDDRSR